MPLDIHVEHGHNNSGYYETAAAVLPRYSRRLSDSDAQRRLIVGHRRGRRGVGLGRRTVLSPLLSLNTLTHIQARDATPCACVLYFGVGSKKREANEGNKAIPLRRCISGEDCNCPSWLQ